jgi:tyrosyl-DNA phosphodiesterase 2
MEYFWVQRNFVLSNVDFPEFFYTNIPGNSFVLKRFDWSAAPYFSFLMISTNLTIENYFRVLFVTEVGRNVFVVDIPVFNSGKRTEPKQSFRLCTTHLELFWCGKVYRSGQLDLISGLFKGVSIMKSRIVAGFVGGDMNVIDRSEHEFYKASDVDLKDVWEDIPVPPVPILKPFQKDFFYDRARGNIWGYQ